MKFVAILLVMIIGCRGSGSSGGSGGSGSEAQSDAQPNQATSPESEAPVALNADSPIAYPPALFEQKVEGNVTLRLFVDSTGHLVPESTRVAETSGYPALDSAALAGAPALRFAPAKRHGIPVATAFLQPVEFRQVGTTRTGAGAGPTGATGAVTLPPTAAPPQAPPPPPPRPRPRPAPPPPPQPPAVDTTRADTTRADTTRSRSDSGRPTPISSGPGATAH